LDYSRFLSFGITNGRHLLDLDLGAWNWILGSGQVLFQPLPDATALGDTGVVILASIGKDSVDDWLIVW
jgi:hypothetical protein